MRRPPPGRSGETSPAAAKAREALVCALSERAVRRIRVCAGLCVGQGLRKRQVRVEPVCRLGGEQMPLVNRLEGRLAPGAAFQHPRSFVGATLEEQSGEVVKASDTRAVGVRAHLGRHVRGEIQHVCEDDQICVAHRASEPRKGARAESLADVGQSHPGSVSLTRTQLRPTSTTTDEDARERQTSGLAICVGGQYVAARRGCLTAQISPI